MPLKLYWPVQSDKILQPFGANPQNYQGFGLPGHEGLDFRAGIGAEIYACADGVVAEARPDADLWTQTKKGSYAYGNQVRIRHLVDGAEYFTVYAHLLEIRVHAGQEVKAGDLVGLADNTGNSFGSHLHLTLKKTGATAAGETNFPRDLMDPTPFLQPFGVKPEPGEGGDTSGGSTPPAPTGTNNLRYVADATIPDNTTIPAGQTVTKTWRVTNSGTLAWGDGYTVKFKEGDPLGTERSHPLTAAQPGQTVEVSIPLTAPADVGKTVTSKWIAADPSGANFGAVLFTVIKVGAAAPAGDETKLPAMPPDGLKFLTDVNFGGNVPLLAGQKLRKIWKVQNSGTNAWGPGYTLASVTADPRMALPPVALPPALPGDDVEVTAMLKTPINPGVYQSRWQAVNPVGQPFGEVLTMVVTIE